VSSNERLATLADLPTAREAGLRLSDEHLSRHFRAQGDTEADR
jgi:tripartite-type tricarboxylate transporter receptor subunit TctC